MDVELTGDWPKPTKKRGDDAIREKEAIGRRLKPAYDGGMSLRQLAEATGYSYGYVHTCLKHAGVTLRERGSNRRPGRVLSV